MSVPSAASKLEDPAYYRLNLDDGPLEITLPTPFCISPESQADVEATFELIKRQMARGVVEYAKRKAAIAKKAGE